MIQQPAVAVGAELHPPTRARLPLPLPLQRLLLQPTLVNSTALMLRTAATLGLGFLTWVLAARLFTPTDVGLASGLVSAIMLCVQIALFGVGAAVVTLLPAQGERPERLLNTAFTLTLAAGLVVAAAFLLLARGAFRELNVASSTPLSALLFLALGALGTAGLLFDQVSIALLRAEQTLVRGVASGVLRLMLIGLVPLVALSANAMGIFSTWVAAALLACLIGLAQLRCSLPGYRYRPALDLAQATRLVAIGLPNYLLTIVDRSPALLLPILTTELLSPRANAYWYAVWTMAWGVFIVPTSVGMVLFAEATNRPATLRRSVQRGVRLSLGLGLLGVLVVGLLAHPLLSLLGAQYAAAGATALRVLLLGVVPLTFIQCYFASSRARQQLREAILAGAIAGTLAVGATVAAGQVYGLVGMAAAWVVAQSLAGLWAGWRLRSLLGIGPGSSDAVNGLVAASALDRSLSGATGQTSPRSPSLESDPSGERLRSMVR